MNENLLVILHSIYLSRQNIKIKQTRAQILKKNCYNSFIVCCLYFRKHNQNSLQELPSPCPKAKFIFEQITITEVQKVESLKTSQVAAIECTADKDIRS